MPPAFQAAGMAHVDILINNAGLALGVASAIEPLAIGMQLFSVNWG